MDPTSDVQGRVLLSAILYRATLRALAGELAGRGLPPPTAEEKMTLHRAVEERAWDLPDDALAMISGRDVDSGVAGLPPLESEVAAFVQSGLARRRVG